MEKTLPKKLRRIPNIIKHSTQFYDIGPREIVNLINTLKNNWCPGIDGIKPDFLKK